MASPPSSTPLPDVSFEPLPPPVSITAASPGDVARDLVTKVRAGGPDSIAAIETAFLESGIPVAGDDGALVASTVAQEGLAINAWEVKLLGSLDSTSSAVVSLSDFAATIASLEPAAADKSVGQMLLDEIKAAAQDGDPRVQTAAQILAELGRQRDGQDILVATDPAEQTLDALQVQLLLYRLANDLLVGSSAAAASAGGPTVALAVARPPVSPGDRFDQAASPPCQFTKSENMIIGGVEQYMTRAIKGISFFDWRANGILGLFGKAQDGNLTGAEQYALALKFASMAADLAKIFATFAMLKVDMDLEGGEPLVRTKTANPGEQKTLAANARLDPGNLQTINCMRLLFAAAGTKFSIPQAQILANKPASWHALEGFGGQIVEFHGDPVHQRTDAAGTARIIVEGAPHKPPVPASARAVEKHAAVRFDIAIKDTTLGDDLLSAINVASNGPMAPIKAALETIYKITIPAASIRFTVRDWDQPDYRIDKTVTGGVPSSASWSIRYTGVKCDGPDGEWAIDTNGTLMGGGDTAAITGTIFVQIPEGATSGKMGGTAKFTDEDPDGATVTEGLFGGTGTFNEEASTLVLDVTTGGGTGYIYGFLDTGVMGPGTLTFPLEAGDFCQTPPG